MTGTLLVVAGEASGDRAAAGVIDALRASTSFRAIGMGGAGMRAAGAELVCDLRDTTALGVGAVARHAGRLVAARHRLLRAARHERPSAALLVNYSDFNATLAPPLHRRGVQIVWYGAPQVWAWRQRRVAALRPHVDRMAVVLPFEEALWREQGVDARYVGHPSLEAPALDRRAARHLLGLTDLARTIAVLPGSRRHEVDALLEPMLLAVERVRRDRASIDARVLLAGSLDRATRARARTVALAHGVPTFDVDPTTGAGKVLPAFDVALTASGTAALEAALARAIPVVAYRVGIVSELVARALVRSPHYALPNVLLGRAAFAEILQRDVVPSALAAATCRALDQRPKLVAECDAVEATLGGRRTPSRAVAEMLLPWLGE